MLPFIGAVALGTGAVLPAYQEDQAKRAEVAEKKQQNDVLVIKLRDRKNIQNERKNLESDISNLRSAVPKTAELDLFMIDLEKMCAQSGVDLIAVETPEAETLRNLDASEQEMNSLLDITTPKGTKPPPAKPPTTTAATTSGTTEQKDKNPTAMKQLFKEVYVTSDYDGLIKLMHKLETYQRVTGVKQVTVTMPTEGTEGGENITAAERGKKLGLHQPVMSFIMTLYYLP
jgi:hypothetical protein